MAGERKSNAVSFSASKSARDISTASPRLDVISIGSRFSFTCSISGKRFFRASLAVMDTNYSPGLVVPVIVPYPATVRASLDDILLLPCYSNSRTSRGVTPSVELFVDSGPPDGPEPERWKKCGPLIIPRSWVRSPPALLKNWLTGICRLSARGCEFVPNRGCLGGKSTIEGGTTRRRSRRVMRVVHGHRFPADPT